MTATPAYPNLYERVKARIKKGASRWPSAYASGLVVKEYKRLVQVVHGPQASPYVGQKSKTAPLSRWFREQWVDVLTGLPCGSVKTPSYYPVCRPKRIASRLKTSEIVDAVARKQRAKEKTATYPAYFRNSV